MPTGVYPHKSPSDKTKERMRLAHLGKAAPWAVGNRNAQKVIVSYAGIHKWIVGQLGQPSQCENCGTTNATRFEWANLSGEYKRNINDWARLCSICHKLIDGPYENKVRPRIEKEGIGQKIAMLVAVRYEGSGMWVFRCDCGNEKLIRRAHVVAGKIKSCGCYQKSFRRKT